MSKECIPKKKCQKECKALHLTFKLILYRYKNIFFKQINVLVSINF